MCKLLWQAPQGIQKDKRLPICFQGANSVEEEVICQENKYTKIQECTTTTRQVPIKEDSEMEKIRSHWGGKKSSKFSWKI